VRSSLFTLIHLYGWEQWWERKVTQRLKQLSARAVTTLREPGRHADGGGLYLLISKTGAKSWVFMFKRAGKRTELGLGSLLNVPLAEARAKAAQCREAIGREEDPRIVLRGSTVPTFGELADEVIRSLEAGWKNEKHKAQWRSTLSTYAAPIRNKPIDKIDTEDVLAVLRPIWLEKAETAQRLRGRIEAVLNAAKAKGFRTGENPAAWRGHLDQLLAKQQKLRRGHHGAMPYRDVPAFIARLHGMNSVSARALKFLILTAARTGEVLGAKWGEIDTAARVWTVPAARMKAGREHRVPLSDAALSILAEQAKLRRSNDPDEPIFPGRGRTGGLSSMALEMILRRMEIKASGVTVHGFRSAFRDWCGEETHFPREVAEAALAHTVRDKVEAAYRRGDALEKRRKLMDEWSKFIAIRFID
jgi:integrase